MGRRGPRKKLAELRRMEGGNLRKRGPIQDPIVVGLGEAAIPEHLMDDAKAAIEMVKQSMPPDVYCKLDTFLLASFGVAWALHKSATEEIGSPDFEHVVADDKGVMKVNPWLKVLHDASHAMMGLSSRLGLDPTSRASLTLPKSDKPSKFDGLLGQSGSLASLSASLSRAAKAQGDRSN